MAEYSPKIAKALHQVMGKCGYVQKKQTNKFHGYNYAGEADLLEVLRPAMIEAGLMLVPSCVDRSEVDQHGNTHVTVEYTLVHKDGDVWPDKIRAFGTGNDRAKNGSVGDKGTYKAITGANKYLLFKLFQIETGDDPEVVNPGVDNADEPEAKQEKSPAKQPDEASKNKARAELLEWAAKQHGADTVDIRQFTDPTDGPGQFSKFMALVHAAPNMPAVDRLKEANEGYVQYLHDQKPEWHRKYLDALKARLSDLSQEPIEGKAS